MVLVMDVDNAMVGDNSCVVLTRDYGLDGVAFGFVLGDNLIGIGVNCFIHGDLRLLVAIVISSKAV